MLSKQSTIENSISGIRGGWQWQLVMQTHGDMLCGLCMWHEPTAAPPVPLRQYSLDGHMDWWRDNDSSGSGKGLWPWPHSLTLGGWTRTYRQDWFWAVENSKGSKPLENFTSTWPIPDQFLHSEKPLSLLIWCEWKANMNWKHHWFKVELSFARVLKRGALAWSLSELLLLDHTEDFSSSLHVKGIALQFAF